MARMVNIANDIALNVERIQSLYARPLAANHSADVATTWTRELVARTDDGREYVLEKVDADVPLGERINYWAKVVNSAGNGNT